MIPGPWKQDRSFYFCLRTGEAIYAQSDNVLTEAEIYQYWDLVEEADRLESRSFIDHECFRATHVNNADNGNIIDGTWVRTWKKIFGPNNTMKYIAKSRMCGRGFLDSQKAQPDETFVNVISIVSEDYCIFILDRSRYGHGDLGHFDSISSGPLL